MGRRDHVFQPVLDPLHRTAQLEREIGADELFGINRRLLAEATAGVRDDHANVGLGHVEMLGNVVPHHVGKLVADPKRQRERIFAITGDTAAAFQAERLLAANAELPLDHQVSVAERRVDVAAFVLALDEIVVLAGVMNERRIVLLAQARVCHRGQWVVIDLDEVASIFRGSAILGDNRTDGLAAETHLVDGKPVLDQLATGEPVGHAAKRIDLAEQLLACEHLDDAGQLPRLPDIDRVEAGVRMLAAQKRQVVHARQLDVVEKAAVTLDQRDCLVRNHRRSNRPLIDEARIRHQTNSWWSRFSALPALRAKRLPPEPRSARRRRWPDSRCIGKCCRTALRALPVQWDGGCPATARSR